MPTDNSGEQLLAIADRLTDPLASGVVRVGASLVRQCLVSARQNYMTQPVSHGGIVTRPIQISAA